MQNLLVLHFTQMIQERVEMPQKGKVDCGILEHSHERFALLEEHTIVHSHGLVKWSVAVEVKEGLKRSPSCSFSRADSQGSGDGTSTSSFSSKNSSTLGCFSIFYCFLSVQRHRTICAVSEIVRLAGAIPGLSRK
jgi:hypothetical protein